MPLQRVPQIRSPFGRAVSGSGGFFAPDIFSHLSFETDASEGGQVTDGENGIGQPDWVRTAAEALVGTHSVVQSVTTGAEQGNDNWLSLPTPKNRLWVKFACKIVLADNTQGITSIMKFNRYYTSQGAAMGGLYLTDKMPVNFDQENTSAGQYTTNLPLTNAQVFPVPAVWQYWELDYCRVGGILGDPNGTWPSMAFYRNDVQITHADGNLGGSPPTNSFWAGNRLYTGERNDSDPLQFIFFAGTRNAGNTNAGNIYFDDISVSSRGRIL